MTTITKEQIDGILPYLDRFEQSGFAAGEWEGPPGQLPWFSFNGEAIDFYEALYDHGWVVPFNWTEWQDEARRYIDSPDAVDAADAETIQKLFTTHVRADRFCEGHLAEMFQNGHIVRLLRRLKVIRQEMEGSKPDDDGKPPAAG